MAHGIEPVAVEIADERRIVAKSVLRAETGTTLVARPILERDRMERIHRPAIWRDERNVTTLSGRHRMSARRKDRERFVTHTRRPVPDGPFVSKKPAVTERRENSVVEGTRATEVRDTQRQVVDHVVTVQVHTAGGAMWVTIPR